MDLDSAINLLKKAVKYTGTIDQKHIDFTVIPSGERDRYEKAMVVATLAIKDGKITKDEFMRRIHLDN